MAIRDVIIWPTEGGVQEDRFTPTKFTPAGLRHAVGY